MATVPGDTFYLAGMAGGRRVIGYIMSTLRKQRAKDAFV